MSKLELYKGLAVVKSKLTAITKGSDNPFFKSKYADLNTHLQAVEPLLEENGMILLQPIEATPEGNLVHSTILHVKSGEMVSSTMRLVGESDMQKAGSAVTYARRYTLGSLLSMMAEDDDGESSMGRKPQPAKKEEAAKKSSFPRSP